MSKYALLDYYDILSSQFIMSIQTLEVEGVPSTSQPPTPTESVLSGPLPTNLAPQVQV